MSILKTVYKDVIAKSIGEDLKAATASAPVVILKHHLFTNFSTYGLEEPTWINVVRDPVDRFVSAYFFRRFGFSRRTGARNEKVKNGEFDIDMDIDDCIQSGAKECRKGP
jgi:hypothetical protein